MKIARKHIPISDEALTALLAARDAPALHAREKYRAQMMRKFEFLNAKHTYVLTRGGVEFGRKRTMTGREARADNIRFEDAFFASKRPAARLMRWELSLEDSAYAAIYEENAKRRARAKHRALIMGVVRESRKG